MSKCPQDGWTGPFPVNSIFPGKMSRLVEKPSRFNACFYTGLVPPNIRTVQRFPFLVIKQTLSPFSVFGYTSFRIRHIVCYKTTPLSSLLLQFTSPPNLYKQLPTVIYLKLWYVHPFVSKLFEQEERRLLPSLTRASFTNLAYSTGVNSFLCFETPRWFSRIHFIFRNLPSLKSCLQWLT